LVYLFQQEEPYGYEEKKEYNPYAKESYSTPSAYNAAPASYTTKNAYNEVKETYPTAKQYASTVSSYTTKAAYPTEASTPYAARSTYQNDYVKEIYAVKASTTYPEKKY